MTSSNKVPNELCIICIETPESLIIFYYYWLWKDKSCEHFLQYYNYIYCIHSHKIVIACSFLKLERYIKCIFTCWFDKLDKSKIDSVSEMSFPKIEAADPEIPAKKACCRLPIDIILLLVSQILFIVFVTWTDFCRFDISSAHSFFWTIQFSHNRNSEYVKKDYSYILYKALSWVSLRNFFIFAKIELNIYWMPAIHWTFPFLHALNCNW